MKMFKNKKKAEPALLNKTLLEVVENQLRDNDPPETAATLERLMSDGESRDEALHLIAHVLSAEINAVLKSQSPFDPERYNANLKLLPKLPQ